MYDEFGEFSEPDPNRWMTRRKEIEPSIATLPTFLKRNQEVLADVLNAIYDALNIRSERLGLYGSALNNPDIDLTSHDLDLIEVNKYTGSMLPYKYRSGHTLTGGKDKGKPRIDVTRINSTDPDHVNLPNGVSSDDLVGVLERVQWIWINPTK